MKPVLLRDPDISGLQKICADYLDEILLNQSEDSDTPHYIFEAAMRTCYGPNIWNWINSAH